MLCGRDWSTVGHHNYHRKEYYLEEILYDVWEYYHEKCSCQTRQRVSTTPRLTAPEWFKKELPADVKLDGELFSGRGQFQSCVGYVKKLVPVDAEWKKVKYCVFDCAIDDKTMEFEERMKKGQDLLKGKQHSHWHPHTKLSGGDKLDTMLDGKLIYACGGCETIEKDNWV